MNRRSFLRSIVAAVALAPVLVRAKEPEKWISIDCGYWILKDAEAKGFGIVAAPGEQVFIHSPRSEHTWTCDEQMQLFSRHEDLYIYGGKHQVFSHEKSLQLQEEEHDKWMREHMWSLYIA